MLSGMKKIPTDSNQRAKAVIDQFLSGEKSEKNPAAVSLGKLGGAARAKSLTPKKRSEIAKKASEKRWSKT